MFFNIIKGLEMNFEKNIARIITKIGTTIPIR